MAERKRRGADVHMLLSTLAVWALTGLPPEGARQAAYVTWVEALAVYILAIFAAGPPAGLWAYRAYRNLPVLGSGLPRSSPVWAGRRLLRSNRQPRPYLPCLVVRELWVVSRPKSRPDCMAAEVWWAALVAAMILWLAGLLNYFAFGGSGQLGDQAIGILGDAALVVSGELAVLGMNSGVPEELVPADVPGDKWSTCCPVLVGLHDGGSAARPTLRAFIGVCG